MAQGFWLLTRRSRGAYPKCEVLPKRTNQNAQVIFSRTYDRAQNNKSRREPNCLPPKRPNLMLAIPDSGATLSP
jgi:hypothetical protein